MLLGNKTDLGSQREIQFKVGEKLAKVSLNSFFWGMLQESVNAAGYVLKLFKALLM